MTDSRNNSGHVQLSGFAVSMLALNIGVVPIACPSGTQLDPNKITDAPIKQWIQDTKCTYIKLNREDLDCNISSRNNSEESMDAFQRGYSAVAGTV